MILFFFRDARPPEIDTLSLPDALPSGGRRRLAAHPAGAGGRLDFRRPSGPPSTMRLVRTAHLRPGDRLAEDVRPDPGSMPLLRAGVELTPRYVDALRRESVPAVWVDDELTAGIEPIEVLRQETMQRATARIHETFESASVAL